MVQTNLLFVYELLVRRGRELGRGLRRNQTAIVGLWEWLSAQHDLSRNVWCVVLSCAVGAGERTQLVKLQRVVEHVGRHELFTCWHGDLLIRLLKSPQFILLALR